jgi:hypothetical protein
MWIESGKLEIEQSPKKHSFLTSIKIIFESMVQLMNDNPNQRPTTMQILSKKSDFTFSTEQLISLLSTQEISNLNNSDLFSHKLYRRISKEKQDSGMFYRRYFIII